VSIENEHLVLFCSSVKAKLVLFLILDQVNHNFLLILLLHTFYLTNMYEYWVNMIILLGKNRE
jgi:hypothetical protein